MQYNKKREIYKGRWILSKFSSLKWT